MQRTIPALIVSVLAASLGSAQPDRSELIAEHANRFVDKQLAPGMMIGVIESGQSSYYPVGSTTYDTDTPPDENTIYEIGSISKVFTALLLADAQFRGELDDQDSLNSHLPDGVAVDEWDQKNPIRLIHLATHASGIPRMPNNIRPADRLNPFDGYGREKLFELLDEMIPMREPGEGYTYSNLAFGILGTVLAMNTDTPYETLMIERVAKPLGLDSTTIALSEDQQARLAPPFKGTTPDKNWDFQSLAGCGAIRSSMADMLRFTESSMRPFPEDLPVSLRHALEDTQEHRFAPGNRQPDVALGWHLSGNENQIVWHNGGTGGYSTFLGFNTEHNVAVVVLANGSSQEITNLGFMLLREIATSQDAADG